jgi:hypothetical protein
VIGGPSASPRPRHGKSGQKVQRQRQCVCVDWEREERERVALEGKASAENGERLYDMLGEVVRVQRAYV